MSEELTMEEKLAAIDAMADLLAQREDESEPADEKANHDEEAEEKADMMMDEEDMEDEAKAKEDMEDEDVDVDVTPEDDDDEDAEELVEADSEAGGGDAEEEAVDNQTDLVDQPEETTEEDGTEEAEEGEDEEEEESAPDEDNDGNDDETSAEIEDAVDDEEKAAAILESLTLPDAEIESEAEVKEEEVETADEEGDEVVVKVDDLDPSEEELAEEKSGHMRGEMMDEEDDEKAMMSDEEEDEDMMDEDEKAMMSDDEEDEDMMDEEKGAGDVVVNKDAGEFLCAAERKAVTSHCAHCVGGCAPENGMPGLADVEAQVKEAHGVVKVLNSGYSPSDDLFLVDGIKADGSAWEYYIAGTGTELGQFRIDPEALKTKSEEWEDAVSSEEAEVVATKEFPGVSHGVDPDSFNGQDAWVVEIDGVDGKSYDVYVALNGGKLLGYDTWDVEDDEDPEVKELEAELALKRLYSRERREEMASEGQALPDGSYPIADEADLKNAIMAYGRAADKAKAKRHIIKRARALGKTSMLPEAWGFTGDDEKALEDEVDSPTEGEDAEAKVTLSEDDHITDDAMADLLAAVEEFKAGDYGYTPKIDD